MKFDKFPKLGDETMKSHSETLPNLFPDEIDRLAKNMLRKASGDKHTSGHYSVNIDNVIEATLKEGDENGKPFPFLLRVEVRRELMKRWKAEESKDKAA